MKYLKEKISHENQLFHPEMMWYLRDLKKEYTDTFEYLHKIFGQFIKGEL